MDADVSLQVSDPYKSTDFTLVLNKSVSVSFFWTNSHCIRLLDIDVETSLLGCCFWVFSLVLKVMETMRVR